MIKFRGIQRDKKLWNFWLYINLNGFLYIKLISVEPPG